MRLPFLIFIAVLSFGNAAIAQEAPQPTYATVPWGQWVMAAAGFVASITLPLITMAARKALGPLSLFVSADAVDRLVQNAVNYALNYVEGAAKGQTLRVELGSQVLAVALTYALDKIPSKLLEWVGGAEGLKEKIFRQLPLEAASSATAVGMAPAYGNETSVLGPSPTR